MERWAKSYGIPIGLVIMKLLITLRTGLDTYHVSSDILDVLVIDGVYLVLWLIAAYAGQGQLAMALRPFAALGAWLLYLAMLAIAWQAGALQGTSGAILVSLVARIAGAVLLSYDTYSYGTAFLQGRKSGTSNWKAGLRGGLSAVAYVVGAVLALPFVLALNILRAGKDYVDDTKRPSIIVESTASPVLPASTPVKLDALDKGILSLYADNPLLPVRDAGKQLGTTHTTVGNRLSKLERNGVIHRNGNGVEILIEAIND